MNDQERPGTTIVSSGMIIERSGMRRIRFKFVIDCICAPKGKKLLRHLRRFYHAVLCERHNSS